MNLCESRNLTEKVATCASLLESPHLGNDTHGDSTTNQGVGEEAGKRYGKTSFLPVLRGVPKIISQDCFRQGWRSPTTVMSRVNCQLWETGSEAFTQKKVKQ